LNTDQGRPEVQGALFSVPPGRGSISRSRPLAGEVEAVSLAQEIHADAILMDDRAGRKAAVQCGLAVVGAIGLLGPAVRRGLIVPPPVLARSDAPDQCPPCPGFAPRPARPRRYPPVKTMVGEGAFLFLIPS